MLATAMHEGGKFGLLNVAEVEGRSHYTFKDAADVLSQLVGMGFDLEGIVGWLEKVTTQEELPLPIVRTALRPFVLLWPRYSQEVKGTLAKTLAEVGRSPRYSKLWEIQRITREQCSED